MNFPSQFTTLESIPWFFLNDGQWTGGIKGGCVRSSANTNKYWPVTLGCCHKMHLTDVLHRTVVVGLVGVTCWGVYAGASVHFNILAAGRQALAERERSEAQSADDLLKQREWQLAQLAQESTVKSHSSQSQTS